MKKIILIITIIVVCLFGILIVYKISTHSNDKVIQTSITDEDKKEMLLLDVILRNKQTKYKDEIYGEYEVDQIVETEYFETFWGQKVRADIIHRDDNDSYIYCSVLMHDPKLGEYEMLKDLRTNMCVFSYISNEESKEKYRYYLKDEKIAFYQDLTSGLYQKIEDKKDSLEDHKLNIEQVCNYYINFNVH
ncbi:MAG: hypothetical protein PHP54_05735 [Clostridia bacterium]|nr:hypothetical protein [Clostridia bacterium]